MNPSRSYDQHVLDLAKVHHVCVVRRRRSDRSTSSRALRTIWIGPIRGPVSYLVSLHELGHVLGPRQARRHGRLVAEAAAWKWGLEHSAWPLSATTKRRCAVYLRTYWDWYERRGRAPLPPPLYMTVLRMLDPRTIGVACD